MKSTKVKELILSVITMLIFSSQAQSVGLYAFIDRST